MSDVELLDPRYDPEPAYWPDLRRRAGLRADWAWDVLTVQAWCSRSRRLVVVEHGADGPTGVLAAAWVTTSTRPNRFVATRRGGRVGILDVRSPGSTAVPGWWFEPTWPAEPPEPAAPPGPAGLSGRAGPPGPIGPSESAGRAGPPESAGATPGLRRRLDGCLRRLRGELGFGCRGVLLRQVPAGELAGLGGLLRPARRTVDVATMDLASCQTLEDWFATLRKSRRRSLRKVINALEADPTLEIRTGAAALEDPVRLAGLMRHNHRKYDGRFGPLPLFTGYLERLMAQPDVISTVYADRATGEPLGVGVILDHPRRPTDWAWAALPAELGGRTDLYFHCYIELVRWALAAGRTSFVLGKGKPEVKVTLGADLVPQYAVAAPLW